MRPTAFLLVIAVLAFAVQGVIYAVGQGNASLLTFTGDIATVVAAICAAAGFWFLFRSISPRIKIKLEHRSVLWTAIAFTGFALGDIAWAWYELVRSVEVPLGTWPDAFWTIAYIALIVGLFAALSNAFALQARLAQVVVGLTLLIAGAFVFVHIMHLINGTHGFVDFIQDLYPVYDILLLGLVLANTLPSIKLFLVSSIFAPGWILFGVTILVRIVFDFAFAHLTGIGTYYTGHPIDLIYTGSYVLGVLTTHLQLKNLSWSAGPAA